MIRLVTTRYDGFTAKINTILTGCLLSKHYKGDFKFIWESDREVKNDSSFHSVPDSVRDLFSDEFILQHYLEVSDMDDFLRPQNKFSLNTFTAGNESEEFFQSPFGFGVLAKEIGYEHILDFFVKKIFKTDISKALASVNNISLPKNLVGVHYRAGDVIYGNVRKKGRYARGKSISLAVCDEVISKLISEGKTPIVFSSSIDDVSILKEKFSDLLSVDDLKIVTKSSYEQVLAECIIMSKCSELITAGDSAVTILAQNLSGVKLQYIENVISNQNELNIYRRMLVDCTNYNNLQAAFCFYNAYLLSDNFEEKMGFLRKSKDLDPDCDLYLTTQILASKHYTSLLEAEYLAVYEKNFNEQVSSILKGKKNKDLNEYFN